MNDILHHPSQKDKERCKMGVYDSETVIEGPGQKRMRDFHDALSNELFKRIYLV